MRLRIFGLLLSVERERRQAKPASKVSAGAGEYFTGFYFSEREHIEHVDGTMYRVPANVWFTSVHGLRKPDGHPGVKDSVLLMAATKDDLRERLRQSAPHVVIGQ